MTSACIRTGARLRAWLGQRCPIWAGDTETRAVKLALAFRRGVFFVNCPPASSVGSRRFRAVSVVAKTTPGKPAREVELVAPTTESPRTGGLGLVVREISGFNQIEYKFGGWLSRELLGLGGPSLGSLGRAWGELPGWVG
ncbi:hypothetical protein ACJJTC_011504 [Scirpophaga incertulas]